MSAADPFFNIEVDGQLVPARHGQSVAAVLLAAGRRTFRYTESRAPRGLFCAMGVCFECLVTINGRPGRRACMTPARPGMHVTLSQDGEPVNATG